MSARRRFFGGSVGRVSVREVGQDVGAASFQGAPQGLQLGAAACGCRFGQRVDERAHHASAPARVLVPVAGDDALVGAVRQPQRVVDGVGEQCVDAFLQGAPQGSQLGAAACGCRFGQRVDERAHHASAPARVLVPVAGDDALVGAVCQSQRVVDGVGEQCVDAFPLAWGAQRGGLEQGAPAVVEAFAIDAAPARGQQAMMRW